MLELKNIYKTYRTNHGVTCRALTNVSLSFEETGLVFIVGKSGGGKSTLLNIIGALDTPDRGSVSLYGNELSKLSGVKLDAYRNTFVGTVFQEYNLLPTLTAERNVSLALGMQGVRRRQAAQRTDAALGLLKIEELRARRSNQLSGGQCQRVAVARALVKEPRVILADEPTGNLDTKTGAEVFEIFKRLSREKLVIIVSHDRETADRIGDRVIEIKDGRVHKDIVRTDRAYTSRVDLVGDRLIRVPKKTEVDERSLRDINEILSANDKDTYIINERDVEKVKSLNIHVKNSVDLATREDELNYYPYTPVECAPRKIKFIRSRMPFSVGLKLSLSTFKYKRFRLAVTVLMLTLALLLSATLASFVRFDADRALAKTLAADGIPNLAMRRQTRYVADAAITDRELAEFASSAPVYTASIPAAPLEPDRTPAEHELRSSLFENFTGIAEVNSLSDVGLTALYGADRAQNAGEVIISQDAANELARLGYFADVGERGIQALVGKRLDVLGRAVTIAGIFACDQSVVADMRLELEEYDFGSDGGYYISLENYGYLGSVSRFLTARKNLTGLLFACEGFAATALDGGTPLTGMFESIGGAGENFSGTLVPVSDMGSKRVVTADAALEENYIVIDLRSYCIMFSRYIDLTKPQTFAGNAKTILSDIRAFNAKNGVYSLNYPASGDSVKRAALYDGLKIKGVYLDGSAKGAGVIYVGDEVFAGFIGGYLMRDALLAPLDGTVNGGMQTLAAARALGLRAESYAGAQYEEFALLLDALKKIIFGIMLVLALIAAALLFSFVSASIKLEKRQIGVLRAMGARGFDTFKTFAIEGSLISLFSIGLAAAVCAFLFPYLNGIISAGTFMSGFYLIINPRTAAYVLATAATVTALGIIIPLVRLVRMTPVDAMNRDGNQR